MAKPAEKYASTIDEAVARLLSRADNARGLSADVVTPRVAAALNKYLFVEGSSPQRADIRDFIDQIRADDLCLIIACEQNDEGAWADLVSNFD